jgi:expansin (peptidoglycan-binding protein)
MVAALTSQQFGNADWCGACAEVVGRAGTRVRIEIVDQCTGCAPGGLDMPNGTSTPYEMLNLPGNPDTCRDGLQPITWKIVPCETSGGIVVHYVEGYNAYTPAVQIRNHRLPLVKLEEQYLGQWVDLPRRADNKYVLPSRTSAASVTLPITIRVTAEDGSTITGAFPPFVAGVNHETTDQF